MCGRMLRHAGPPPQAGSTRLVPDSAYGNNAEARVSMAATITAHNPSEISDITISASPALRRRGASGADRSDVAKPCRDRRLTGYVRSEAVSLSNGSSLYRSRRAHAPPIAGVKNPAYRRC